MSARDGRGHVLLFGVIAGVVLSVGALLLIRRLRHHAGLAERAGLGIDASVKKAAEGLSKAAAAIEEKSDQGLARRAGRSIDDTLGEAKTVFGKGATRMHVVLGGNGKR
jgi:hypothetical protein